MNNIEKINNNNLIKTYKNNNILYYYSFPNIFVKKDFNSFLFLS